MYVKSIVLDGFKSYGNRVEITGFDPEFNAITGLNGTGKSNILDSICFVLGITNLSNVRAGSLQELIYKHGQAGITKATVSITFDNRDKKQCPIGYENHDEITVTRQVVMGGKNKYLINGINVQNKRVSDLFCSVQLNVNNPHFLIMQGRITKVLNMKPPEILSMVEEAAGTRMYEAKKQAAQKTIEKKDAKLRELNDIIVEDVAPKLQKLQDERAQFQEYQKVLRELENLTRLNVAYKYVTAEEKTKEAEGKVTEVQNDIKAKKDTIEENKKEAKNLDKQVVELNKKLDEESGSILKDLEAQLLEVEKTEASSSAAHKAAKEALATHEKRAKLMDKALRDDEVALAEKEKELDKVSSTFSALEAASSQGSATLQTAQQAFLAASAGRGETGGSLQTMLIEAKQAASEASTRVSAGGMQKRHLSERLRTLEREFAANAARFQADQEDIGRQQAEVDKLKSQLSRSSHSAEQLSALATSVRQEQAALRVARDRRDTLAARLQRCQLVYTDPEAGFDRRRVHGTVCRLISVQDPKYCTALETAAGGRLYNVVVDTEVTSKLLLTRGRLQTRTTIIPLNKISAQGIDAGTLSRARQLGGGADKVQLALDLVDFDPVVRPAIVWVLGGTLVCADLDVARRVAFSDVRRRCVTMDGDVVDPAGTLTGGARSQGGSVLVQLKELKEMEQTVQRLESELADHSAELHAAQRDADTHARAQQRYEQASYELEVIKARLANTTHAQTHKEIEALRAQVAELTEAIERDKVIQKESAAKAKELEEQVKDIKGHREREFKKAEAALKKAKEDFETHNNRWKQHEQESAALQLEVEELRRAVAGARGGAGAARGEGERLKGELGRKGDDLRAATEAVKEVQARIKRQKNEISARNTDIARLHQNKEQLAKKNGELELNIKELQYTITELQTEAAECEKRMSSLSRAHVWLSTEREFFGLPGGVYDFTARRADLCGQRLAQLQERRDKLARGLNARAHTLLASEEEQYNDVMRKKRIVEADRAKLVQVMAELDDKKRKTLVAACEQVNKDFGSIFSTLLPGAQAKLKPRDGLTVLDGLEVKVGFNNTWKDSLGELSGGQRSLVALSLVLAMLLFHPAPLYILDEVDAALDLEHTQNIGLMLRNHFRHSQFIIVSLKNGMFNNANVLFSTKFVDGMSSVSRTVNSRR